MLNKLIYDFLVFFGVKEFIVDCSVIVNLMAYLWVVITSIFTQDVAGLEMRCQARGECGKFDLAMRLDKPNSGR